MGKVLIYSDFREKYSGGVSLISSLMEIKDIGFISFLTFLKSSMLNEIFVGNFQKQKKSN